MGDYLYTQEQVRKMWLRSYEEQIGIAQAKALEERTLPVTVVWFREGRYSDYGAPYCIIKHHYFSTEEEKQK